MLKLNSLSLHPNTQITLTERWHELLESFSKTSNLPYQFVLVTTIKVNKEKYFIFKSENHTDKKSYRIAIDEFLTKYIFAEGIKKCTCKFLLHEDESYMTDYEKMFKDTIIHKNFVKKSAKKLIRYLEKENAFEHATLLRQRTLIHDDSKLSCTDELHALSRIINDKTTLRDASKQLSPIKKDAIALHWKHNSHHPEHFKTPIDMQRIDIMEMCCDWHAHSTQYKTEFIAYVQKQQEERFHFSEWMFAEIMHYCRILDSEY